MTDREMLELAARAAGMQMNIVGDGIPGGRVTFYQEPACVMWNPLDDDGDAFRLAVKLKMDVAARGHARADCVGYPVQVELMHDDPYAATRRAIVRAAAEIGRQMEVQS